MMDGFQSIGQLKKPHGLRGELKIEVEDRFLEDLLEARVLYVDLRGTPLPYFIAGIRGEGMLLIKLEEVDSREDAMLLSHREVFLPAVEISVPQDEEPEPDALFAELIGYRIVDRTHGEVGPVEDVVEYPQQWMAVVRYRGREVLIPLVEAFIRELNPEERLLAMELPEGLLDL